MTRILLCWHLQIIGLISIGFIFLPPWNINRNANIIQYQIETNLEEERSKTK